MIIKPKEARGDYVTMKLTSGDEIIGTVTETTDNYVSLKNVVKLHISQRDGAQFIPMLITAPTAEDLTFMRSQIVVLFKHKDLKDPVISNYITATSSIVVPNSGLVM